MATKKKKQSAAAEIDWYLISIDRLKQIGLVVLLLLLGGAGYWFWQNQKGNPKSNAEAAIAEARQSLNALAAAPEFNTHRNEFNRAQQKLDEAGTHFTAGRFTEAQGAAVESHTISRSALTGGADLENDAQFLTVEGDVQYQKGQASEWKDADARTPLMNGDWVKTGGRASAELMFSNGTLYTVGPNALLEIYSAVAPGTSEKTNAVTMRVGSIKVETDQTASTVRTPGSQVVIESKSLTEVDIDTASKETDVTSARGAAAVTPAAGGPAVRLAAGERVSATAQGALSPVKKLTPAPALLSPGDNQVLQLTPDLQVEMIWEPQPAATTYILQVSRSRLFSTQEINSRRQKTSARAQITSEGAFFWRVASIGPDGEVGPFSAFRRFRVVGGGKSGTGDKTPPRLQLKPAFHVGSQFFTISGTTEPGATVFINDEEVDVESTGTFQKVISFPKIGRNDVVVKAVDAEGNQTVQSQTVIVPED
jgi:Glucodextranase, domain B/FecR protein